jgi:hypothetical protein
VLQVQAPPISLEGHLLKYGSALVAAQFPAFQEPPRQHPVMRAAQELAELLQLLGVMEGQSPQAVAGGRAALTLTCTGLGPTPAAGPRRLAAAPLLSWGRALGGCGLHGGKGAVSPEGGRCTARCRPGAAGRGAPVRPPLV